MLYLVGGDIPAHMSVVGGDIPANKIMEEGERGRRVRGILGKGKKFVRWGKRKVQCQ